MINNVTLIGRLTKDPELRYTASGIAVARFTLAVNRNFKNSNGEQEADFISVQCWRKLAENVANYCRKGSLVGIVGRIQTGSYEKDGNRFYTTDVVADSVQFLDTRSDSRGANKDKMGTNQQQSDPFIDNGPPINITDDDLPF